MTGGDTPTVGTRRVEWVVVLLRSFKSNWVCYIIVENDPNSGFYGPHCKTQLEALTGAYNAIEKWRLAC